MNELERLNGNWQIYEVMVPGIHSGRTVVAASLERALAIAIRPDDRLQQGELMVVQNVTASWICLGPKEAASTFAVLKERREGHLEFDHREGWTRSDPE